MTKAMKFILERLNDPEFNRNSEATKVDKELIKQNEAAYNRMQAKYPTVADLPFELPEDFRDM